MTDPSRPRRRLLRAVVASASFGLAGCSTDDQGGTPTPEETTAAPTATDSTETSGITETGDATETAESTTRRTTASREPRDVEFTDPAGATVAATLYPGGSCAVVLVPQINMDRESWRPQAERLVENGYAALAIDEHEDDRAASVVGAIDHLRDLDAVERVVLVGASSGGEAVVRANARAESGSVAGTITLSAAGGAERAGDLQGRLLFVVSENDDRRFVETARTLHENAPDPKRLLTFDGAAHGQRLFASEHADALTSAIDGLLAEACGG